MVLLEMNLRPLLRQLLRRLRSHCQLWSWLISLRRTLAQQRVVPAFHHCLRGSGLRLLERRVRLVARRVLLVVLPVPLMVETVLRGEILVIHLRRLSLH